MIQKLPTRSLLEELDTRHDEVLEQLDQLSERVEAALREASGTREPALAATPAVFAAPAASAVATQP